MKSITIRVVGVPQPKGSTKGFPVRRKNGKMGVAITSSNPQLKPWALLVAWEAAREFGKADIPKGPVYVTITFSVPRPKSHYDSKGNLKWNAPIFSITKPDVDKLERGILDALTGICWKDDAQVAMLHSWKKYTSFADGQSGRPGAFITVEWES